MAAKLIVDGKAKLADSTTAQAAEERRRAMQGPGAGVERMVVSLAGLDKSKKLKG